MPQPPSAHRQGPAALLIVSTNNCSRSIRDHSNRRQSLPCPKSASCPLEDLQTQGQHLLVTTKHFRCRLMNGFPPGQPETSLKPSSLQSPSQTGIKMFCAEGTYRGPPHRLQSETSVHRHRSTNSCIPPETTVLNPQWAIQNHYR